MIKSAFAGLPLSIRTASAAGSEPDALFLVRPKGEYARAGSAGLSALKAAIENTAGAFGLRGDICGGQIILRPSPILALALGGLGAAYISSADRAPVLPALERAYAMQHACSLAQRALMREFSALPHGSAAPDMAILAQGLRLIEGPASAAQRAAFQKNVRQAGAYALRKRLSGDALRACAYIIAYGDMEL